jgi:hypothetical protein
MVMSGDGSIVTEAASGLDLDEDFAAAALDGVDEETRAGAECFRAADEKTLERFRTEREQALAALEAARERIDEDGERRLHAGIALLDSLIVELEAKIAGGAEAYGYYPRRRAIEGAAEKAHATEERKRIQHRRDTAPKCGWRKHEEMESRLVGSFDGRSVVFDGSETAAQQLDKLLAVATEIGHPAVDSAGIETMKTYIASGRFDHAHYISLWRERLTKAGVTIEGLESTSVDGAVGGDEARGQPQTKLLNPEPEPEPEQLQQPEPRVETEGHTPAVDAVQPTAEQASETPPKVRSILFDGTESEEQKLDLLLELASELEHPGIDPEGIATMKGFIQSGRFEHDHYIRMWSKRLLEMGVVIGTAAPTDVVEARALGGDIGRALDSIDSRD